MQEQLLEVYEKFKNKADFYGGLSDRLSAPLLLHVPDRWKSSNRRVLIVGQETMGWDFRSGKYYDWPFSTITNWSEFKRVPDSVPAMVHGYKCFEFARREPNYSSPFWQAYRQFREALGEPRDGIDTSVLWTNLFRMSLDGGSVMDDGQETTQGIGEASREILIEEMRIIQPTAVVFFTGPKYEESLCSTFRGIEFSPFNGFDQDRTARAVHSELPAQAWRTYHPQYLSYSKQWDVIEEIINELRGF
jgi:hypothetical protein